MVGNQLLDHPGDCRAASLKAILTVILLRWLVHQRHPAIIDYKSVWPARQLLRKSRR
jgi:hypothetical protein